MSRPGYIDKRGNAKDRARRRTWVLCTFDPELGPHRARCRLRLSVMCHVEVDPVTLSVDRIEQGGSYRRGNIQPACKPCQDKQGGLTRVRDMAQLIGAYRDARDAWELRFETECNQTYRRGIIQRELRKARRGGRNEVYDFVEKDPPPLFRDWLTEWAESQREPEQGGASAPAS